MPTLDEARGLLRAHFGYHDFRPPQRRVISSVLRGRDTLAILPTGGGKSLCFQIPALLLDGITIVISPLISLMQDQVAGLRARGVTAAALNSTVKPAEQRALLEAAARGRLKLLYTSPERLKRLVDEVRDLRLRIGLLAVDEAHCVSEWGHDFRPSYRALRHRRARLGHPLAVALTGSATPAVAADIVTTLGLGSRRPLDRHRDSFDRPNLWFGVRTVRSEAQRLRRLLDLLHGDDHLALVYAPTRNSCEALARSIARAGHLALPYHAGLSKARRQATLERFLGHRAAVITATSAFGMGIDKSDVRLVVHWTVPPSPEAYYQEAGRAGRDGLASRCVLLYRPGDARIHRLQAGVTFPDEGLVQAVWRGEAPPGTPHNVLQSAERLRRELRPGGGRHQVDWRPVRRRRRVVEQRIDAMERYATGRRCRRRRLLRYFGERLGRCSGCDRCGRTSLNHLEPAAVGPEVLPAPSALLEDLYAWRGATAARLGIQPFQLLPERACCEIARRRPASPAELSLVPGLGPRCHLTFGREILRLVAGQRSGP